MERYDILDDDGTVVGTADRHEVHGGSRLLHGVVHLLVFNRAGELLLQRRAATKDIEPDKWDTSVGGHIDAGETVERALARETFEELGISGASCQRLYTYIMDNERQRELVHTYRCRWEDPIRYGEDEISAVKWFTPAEIDDLVGSGQLTPNFEEEWDYYKRWSKVMGTPIVPEDR